jgi:hypothetical protein
MNNKFILRRPVNEQASYVKDTLAFLHVLSEQFQLPLEVEIAEECCQGAALEVELPTGSDRTTHYCHRTWQVYQAEQMEQVHLVQGDHSDETTFLAALAITEENGSNLYWVLSGDNQIESNRWTALQLAAQSKGVQLIPVSAREVGRALIKDPTSMPVLLTGNEVGEVITGLIGDILGVFGVFTEQRQQGGRLQVKVVADGKKGYLVPIQLGEILVRHLGAEEVAREVRKTGSRIMNWLVQPGAGADPLDLPLDERWGLLLTTALTDGEAFAPRRRRIDESLSTII